jgi:hypothetical protein
MRGRKKWYVWAPLALVAGIVFLAVGGVVVRELWNWLVPSIFGWRAITFWQALGLLALARILFGGHSWGGRHRGRRWEHMTPEQRERFREAMRARYGDDAAVLP